MKRRIKSQTGGFFEENIISGDDILMSDPDFPGKTLAEVLKEQKETIRKLSQNVKFLTKYGGIGGGGGGTGGTGGSGTGTVKTKFTSTISYTNINGLQQTTSIRQGSYFVVKSGTSVSITVILTSIATRDSYSMILTNGTETASMPFSGTEKTCTMSFVPESNIPVIVQVSGETTPNIEFGIYLNTNEFYSSIRVGDTQISDNGTINATEISDGYYRMSLINYLPDVITDDSLLGFSVNSNYYQIVGGIVNIEGIEYTVSETKDNEKNTKTLLLDIDSKGLKKILTGYGIYKFTAYYKYNNNTLSQEKNYIYKDIRAFIYSYSSTSTPILYQESKKNPDNGSIPDDVVSSYGYTENFLYRLYNRSDGAVGSNEVYQIYYTIYKEGDTYTTTSYDNIWKITINDKEENETKELENGESTIYYYDTYTIINDSGNCTGEGRSSTSGSNYHYKVTISKNESSYIKKIETYNQPVSKIGQGTDYDISFSNSYLPKDFNYVNLGENETFIPGKLYYIKTGNEYSMISEESPRQGVTYYKVVPKEITINYYVKDSKDQRYDSISTYYIYVGRTKDIEYVFTGKTGNKYYSAVHTSTLDPADSGLFSFPWSNGKYKLTASNFIGSFKGNNSVCTSSLPIISSIEAQEPTVSNIVSGVMTDQYGDINKNYGFGKDPVGIDGMFSFGIRHYDDNYDKEILRICYDENNLYYISVYKTKIIRYENGSKQKTYTKFVIPSDGQYHLISFYLKNKYVFNGDKLDSSNNSVGSNGKSSILVLIDGVIELEPITFSNSPTLSLSSNVVWYSGQWDYDFMGVMTFNGMPKDLDSSRYNGMPGISLLRKYYHDFDIIIPSNYFQAYREYHNVQEGLLTKYTDIFDYNIYNSLSSNKTWINYYTKRNNKSVVDKFIKVNDLGSIASLSSLPIYVVRLESTGLDKDMNSFLEKTLESFPENATTPEYTCGLERVIKSGDSWASSNIFGDVRFSITYQGSSTLLYGAKNFYIKSKNTTENGVEYSYYWTPNKNKFKPELGFNFKADMVDSSHSNNVVIGDFVNQYFGENEDPKFVNKSEGHRSCLTGEPVILVMTDSIYEENETNYVLLGIYNLNLTRSSVMNLGYQTLDIDNPNCSQKLVSSNFSNEALLYKVGSGCIKYPEGGYIVAEVQGNSRTLFDYSQYDRGLTKYMLDDFFTYTNNTPGTSYTPSIQKAFKGLNKLVYNDIIENFNTLELANKAWLDDNKTTLSSGDYYYMDLNGNKEKIMESDRFIKNSVYDRLDITQYSIIDQQDGTIISSGNPYFKFYPVINDDGSTYENNGESFYYYKTGLKIITTGYYFPDGVETPQPIGQKDQCMTEDEIEALQTYGSYIINSDGRKISIVGNPKYQFHQVVNEAGNKLQIGQEYYYYVEKIDNIGGWRYDTDDKFHYINALKYYITCMAFAMVDSVQKNLTIKCSGFDEKKSNTWYLGFYDMDTAFGVNNAGGEVDFKAFSDFIDDSGEIIQDYFPQSVSDSLSIDGSVFDVPSSYLFLYAKYGNILHTDKEDNPIVDIKDAEGDDYATPLNYWLKLRSIGGEFETAEKFCNKYIDRYFGDMNPLIWNLNYMYKYFSETKSGGSEDTEITRFNGTMKHRRKFWLENRFKVLDVLFGIKNDSRIGKSSYRLNGTEYGANIIVANSDIEVAQSMFSGFTKGYPVPTNFSFIAEGEPKTPLVLQSTTDRYRLYIIDATGKTSRISVNLTSNTDIGFFGSRKITKLDEFGPFLLASRNTINNNLIKTIDITQGFIKNSNNIDINLNTLRSLNSINIDVRNSSNKSFGQITIQLPDSSGINPVLNNVTINNINATALIIINNNTSGNTFTIKNLNIQNSTIKQLDIRNVSLRTKFTMDQSNSIESYNISGALGDLDIIDGTCKLFSVNSTDRMSLTAALPIVTSVSFGGNIEKIDFTNGNVTENSRTESKTCTSVTTSNLGCNDITIWGASVSNVELNLTEEITDLTLNLHKSSVTNLTINANKFKNLIYRDDYALFGCNLSDFKIKTSKTVIPKDVGEAGINIYYKGSGIAKDSGSNWRFILPYKDCESNYYLSKVDTASSSGITCLNSFLLKTTRRTSVSNDNLQISGTEDNPLGIQSFLKYIQIDPNLSGGKTISMSSTFRGICFKDGMLPTKDGKPVTGGYSQDDVLRLPDSYTSFVSALREFKSNIKANGYSISSTTSLFAGSNFAIYTRELCEILGIKSITDNFGSYVDNNSIESASNNRRTFVEVGLLGKMKSVNLGAYDKSSSPYSVPHVVLFYRTNEFGNADKYGKYLKIITNPGFSDAFESKTGDNFYYGNDDEFAVETTAVTSLAFYMDDTVSFNCKPGWPSSIKTISEFQGYTGYVNFQNIDDMFSRTSQIPTVNLDGFLFNSTISSNVTPMNLYEFIVDSKGNFKFLPSFNYKVNLLKSGVKILPGENYYRNGNSLGFTYPKRLETSNHFKHLLKIFKYGDGTNTATEVQKDLSEIFSYCTLINDDNSTWKDLIEDTNVTEYTDGEYFSYFDNIRIDCFELNSSIDPKSKAESNEYVWIKVDNKYKKVMPYTIGPDGQQTCFWIPDGETYENFIDNIDERYYLEKGNNIYSIKTPTRFLLSLDGTFKGFKMYNSAQTKELEIDVESMFNLKEENTVYTLANAFYGCKLKELKNPLNIGQNVMSMYNTFRNCRYVSDIECNYEWIPTDIQNRGGVENYKCIANSLDENGEYQLIPNKFFDVCKNASIDYCFATDNFSSDSLQGQLYSENNDNPWWTGSGKVSYFNNLITNARIHPIIGETQQISHVEDGVEIEDGSKRVNIIFPNWYISKICQCNVYIPLFIRQTNASSKDYLCIFESIPSGGSNYGGRLPDLPPTPNGDSGIRYYYNLYLGMNESKTGDDAKNWTSQEYEYSIYLVDPTGGKELVLSSGSTYKNFLPLRLADVLHLNNKTLFDTETGNKINFASSQPIIKIDGTLYYHFDFSSRFSLRYWRTDDVYPEKCSKFLYGLI